jgi:hypothetical protein
MLNFLEFAVASALVQHLLQVARQHLYPTAGSRVVVNRTLLPLFPAQEKGYKVAIEPHERPRVPAASCQAASAKLGEH